MDEPALNRLIDVTFVIPVRIDSPERARNLDVLIDYLIRRFDATILVLEADRCRRYFLKNPHHRIRYFFVEDQNPVFHRTFYLNMLYCKVDTPIIAVWDTDVLACPEQVADTVAQIRVGKAVFGIPYDGRVYQVTAELSQRYGETKKMDILQHSAGEFDIMYGDVSTGGAFIVDRKKYLRAGGENEFFLGWGPEDLERVKRMEILYPKPIYRANGPLFHLWHPKYLNSNYANREYELTGKKELLKVCGMTVSKLRNYINSWPWLERLQPTSGFY